MKKAKRKDRAPKKPGPELVLADKTAPTGKQLVRLQVFPCGRFWSSLTITRPCFPTALLGAQGNYRRVLRERHVLNLGLRESTHALIHGVAHVNGLVNAIAMPNLTILAVAARDGT